VALTKPRLKLSHAVIRSADGNVAIGELGRRSFLVRDPPQVFLDLLFMLDGSRTVPRVVRDLRRNHDVSEADVVAVLERLNRARVLDDGARESSVLSSAEMERYDRQQLQFSAIEQAGEPGFVYQERLKQQVVGVLGMGGWGTWLSLNLALAGFGTLRLVDADFVELSNLNRQVLYDETSLGKPKVEAAAAALDRINPHVNIEVVQEFVEPDRAQIERVIDGTTLLCLCWANQSHFVNGTSEELIHELAFARGIPVLEVAGDPFDISVGPVYLNDGASPCLRCVRPRMQQLWWDGDETISELRKADVKASPLRKVNAWQSAPSLSAIAGLAVNEAMALATGYVEPGLVGRRLNISMQSYATSMDQFERDPACAWCSGGADRS
jgi:molybdopterin/thiamine biosynthesis adenylyltransferase